MILAKMASKINQKAQAGDNSFISQIVVQELMINIFGDNFPKLAAKEKAQEKATELQNIVIEKISLLPNLDFLENLSSPRRQNDLYEAQKGFALSNGEVFLKETLADLLISGLKENDDSSRHSIILSEAIKVIGNLNKDDFRIMAFLFLMKDSYNKPIHIDDLIKIMEHHIEEQGLLNLEITEFKILHLEYHRCIRIERMYEKYFGRIMEVYYPGLFAKGLPLDEIMEKLGTHNIPSDLVSPCLNDKNLYQINALNREKILEMNLSPNIQKKSINILEENSMRRSSEIEEMLSKKSEILKHFISQWNESLIAGCTLSLVGKTIANTYMRNKSNHIDEFLS